MPEPDVPQDDPTTLPERLARAITLAGPVPVSRFMAAANDAFYRQGPSIGSDGDFVTAPEISQMFGELIGVWITDLWTRAGQPPTRYVELGPGRGTLAADALRVMRRAGLNPPVSFVETAPRLRAEQSGKVPDATWHDDVTQIPDDDSALIIVANEFFDALPIEQLVRGAADWHRRLVACQDTLFLPVAGPPVPDAIISPAFRDAPAGSIIESSPTSVAVVAALSQGVARRGGAMLVIDYGYDGPAVGETLQAVRHHRFANPFDAPGRVDLSAHVDFMTLAAAAAQAGVRVHGPTPQRDFLGQLGLATRSAALARSAPERSDEIAAAHARLTASDAMGTLFRAMAFTGDDWPDPAGFA